MQPAVPRIAGVLGAVRDDAYTTSKHTTRGKQVQRHLAQGREAHVFDDGIDLRELEEKVWTQGAYLGRIGNVSQALFDRFVWQSPTPIGRRIQVGRPDLPLTWVEIKGKIVKGVWVYHLVPRRRPVR